MKVLHDAGLVHQVEIIKRLLQAEAGARSAKDALQDIDIINLRNLITALPQFDIEVVESLPLQDMSDTTIYLVTGDQAYGNLYTEYIWVDDKWEVLGTQTVMGLEPMSQATASAGTSTNAYSISAKVLHDTIEDVIQDNEKTTVVAAGTNISVTPSTSGNTTTYTVSSAGANSVVQNGTGLPTQDAVYDYVEDRINDMSKIKFNITQPEDGQHIAVIWLQEYNNTFEAHSPYSAIIKMDDGHYNTIRGGGSQFITGDSFELIPATYVFDVKLTGNSAEVGDLTIEGAIDVIPQSSAGTTIKRIYVREGATINISATPAS